MRLATVLRRVFSWAMALSMLPVVIAVLLSGYITYRYNAVLNETRQLIQHSLETTTAIDDSRNSWPMFTRLIAKSFASSAGGAQRRERTSTWSSAS